MIRKAVSLTSNEFRQITAQELEKNRAFVRDVHFTINKSRRSVISGIIELEIHSESANGKWSSTTFVEAFPVSDDLKYVYFFENGWPCHYNEFLNPEDVIPSGLFTLNTSKGNMRRVLEQLKAEKAGMEMVELSNEFFQSTADIADIKDEAGNKVQVSIDTIEMLNWAIYCCNRHVCNLLGTEPIMFTKELKRTDGKVVERYNHKLRVWEITPGKPKFSNTWVGILQKAKSLYATFIG